MSKSVTHSDGYTTFNVKVTKAEFSKLEAEALPGETAQHVVERKIRAHLAAINK